MSTVSPQADGQCEGDRTPDLPAPNRALYLAELHKDMLRRHGSSVLLPTLQTKVRHLMAKSYPMPANRSHLGHGSGWRSKVSLTFWMRAAKVSLEEQKLRVMAVVTGIVLAMDLIS